MLNRFSEWVKNFSDDGSAVPTEDDDFVATITALLVEAAMADGTLDVDERSQIYFVQSFDIYTVYTVLLMFYDIALLAQNQISLEKLSFTSAMI